ncbi:MAG: peptidoglycan DD-metalloendopeptidase family protein [Chlorobiaceae bacterium]|jgi:murein hydrolase activator|nr:peptidoglycan DD-metalloendopeptidase family protein [Chlorobiaceae bacterium]NTW63858.1 peptidoglycan DD-metalloendopeptidase family protein [Chlorobiaceae bacterium]
MPIVNFFFSLYRPLARWYRLPLTLMMLLLTMPLSDAGSVPVKGELGSIIKERKAVELTLKNLKKQLDEYQTKLSITSRKESQSLKILENIRHQILVLERLINENQQYMSRLDVDIDRLSGELDSNRTLHRKVSEDFSRTAVSVYKYGKNRETEHLFASGSANEALIRSQYMGFFSRAVKGDVQKLQRAAVTLENSRMTLEHSYREKAAAVSEQQKQLKTYDETKKEKENVLAELKKNKKVYAVQIAETEKKRKTLQSRIQGLVMAEQRVVAAEQERQRKLLEARRLEQQRLEASRLEKKRLEAKEQEAKLRSNEKKTVASQSVTGKKDKKKSEKQVEPSLSRQPARVVPGSQDMELEKVSVNFERAYGSLPWPVSGGVVAQRFGSVEDRDLKIVKTNNGIDISVPAGTSVRAVSGGKVVQIAYMPTFGNIVIVRHPNSYLTVYANLGSLRVAKNEVIRSQQLIGVSGKMPEGGSVVHFEIWKGRVKQNPEQWLRR